MTNTFRFWLPETGNEIAYLATWEQDGLYHMIVRRKIARGAWYKDRFVRSGFVVSYEKHIMTRCGFVQVAPLAAREAFEELRR